MKSSKLPGMLSVKSKKGLDYMDMILSMTSQKFQGQMAVNNMSLNIGSSVYGLLGEWGWQIHDLKCSPAFCAPHQEASEFDGHPWKRNDLEHIDCFD